MATKKPAGITMRRCPYCTAERSGGSGDDALKRHHRAAHPDKPWKPWARFTIRPSSHGKAKS